MKVNKIRHYGIAMPFWVIAAIIFGTGVYLPIGWWSEFHEFPWVGFLFMLLLWCLAYLAWVRGYMWLRKEELIDGKESNRPFGL